MTESGLDELSNAMGHDGELAAELGNASTVAEFIAATRSRGFEITVDDMTGGFDAIPLSDTQLTLVGGGYREPIGPDGIPRPGLPRALPSTSQDSQLGHHQNRGTA